VTGILFEAIEPGQTDYSKLIDKLQAEGIDALYFGGYTAEAGLIIRQARSRGYDLQIIGSDALTTEYFRQVAGPAAMVLRTQEFDSILGMIGFDDKGDVYGYEPFVWCVWQEGNYAPADPAKLVD
jgi:ABC-type branched-subunit amino acid transport system substrate-binding protein